MGPRKTYRVVGYQKITSLSASVGLTLPTAPVNGTVPNPNAVLLQAETQTVRFRDDGTAPTAANGMILQTGQMPFYYDGDLKAIRFIETTASAALNVLYVEDVANA